MASSLPKASYADNLLPPQLHTSSLHATKCGKRSVKALYTIWHTQVKQASVRFGKDQHGMSMERIAGARHLTLTEASRSMTRLDNEHISPFDTGSPTQYCD